MCAADVGITCRSSASSSATRPRSTCTTPTSARSPPASCPAAEGLAPLPALAGLSSAASVAAAALSSAVGLLAWPCAAAAAAAAALESCASAFCMAGSLDAAADACNACRRSRPWSRCVSAVTIPERNSLISSWQDSCKVTRQHSGNSVAFHAHAKQHDCRECRCVCKHAFSCCLLPNQVRMLCWVWWASEFDISGLSHAPAPSAALHSPPPACCSATLGRHTLPGVQLKQPPANTLQTRCRLLTTQAAWPR